MNGAGLPRLVRAPEWWHSKLPPLLAIAYFLLGRAEAVAWPAVAALLPFLASAAGTAACGHLWNDLGDLEADRRAGRERPLAALPRRRRTALLLGATLLAVFPWALLPPAPLAWALLAAELALLAAYALPPLRLKERGLAGALADSLYGHALPAAITAALFAVVAGPGRGLALAGALLLAWKGAQGLCGALVGQVRDRRADRAAGTRSFARRFGPRRTLLLVNRLLLPAQAVAFAALLAWATPALPWLLPAFALHLLWTAWRIHRRWGHGRAFYRTGYPGYAYLNDFHERWLPLLVLPPLALGSVAGATVSLLHLALFRTGLDPLLGLRRGAAA
ncbi:MAG: UbiA family prenyltransferase [Thermoanaerobaculia bacterium]|nr:UbiA family prenyltransferase [Thermoanaerobaculia bacterium]